MNIIATTAQVEGGEGRFVPVAPANRIPLGGSLGITVDGTRYAIFHTEEGWFCITNRCPHQGAPLAGSPLVKGTRIKCVLHGWQFELNPDKPGGRGDELCRPPVRIVDGMVEIAPPLDD